MRLDLVNFMSHDKSTITLPERGVVIVTGPNGAGKSAVIEGVATALWGRGLRGRWSPWRAGEAGRVTLADPGLDVQRTWTGKSKGLVWSRGDESTKFDTTSKAQEGLDAVIGTFDVWRRTNVFSSADAAHFTQATDAERKELLESLLGLGWFDRALTLCRSDLKAAQTLAGQAEAQKSVAIAKASGLDAGIKAAQKMLGELAETGDIGLMRIEATKIAGHLNDIATERAAKRAARTSLLMAGGADKERAQSIAARLAKLQDAECYACGQKISSTVRSSMQASVDGALRAAHEKEQASSAALAQVTSEIEELDEECEGLQAMQARARDTLNSIEHAKVSRMRIERSLKDQLDTATKSIEQITNAQAVLNTLAVEIVELEACERVLGVRGARAHVVGKTLAGIEALANSWLQRLSSTITIKLKPYTEKKSGSVVDAISLDLVGAGGEHGYLGASGGERRRVDVALLLALAELAAGTSNGAQWRSPIFFDEVFDSLDGDGRAAVGELIGQLAEDRCVVLITHEDGFGWADLRIRIDAGCVT